MADKNETPLWLEKDGQRHFYAAGDVAAARANGWTDPKGVRGNGEPWNPEPVEDERTQVDAIEDVLKATGERDAKRAERKAKEEAEAVKAAEDARDAAPVKADLKVEVVEPKAKKSAK